MEDSGARVTNPVPNIINASEIRLLTLWPCSAAGHGSTEQIRKGRGFARRQWVDNAIEADGEVIQLQKFGRLLRVVSGVDKISCVGREELVDGAAIMEFVLGLEFQPEVPRLLLRQSCGTYIRCIPVDRLKQDVQIMPPLVSSVFMEAVPQGFQRKLDRERKHDQQDLRDSEDFLFLLRPGTGQRDRMYARSQFSLQLFPHPQQRGAKLDRSQSVYRSCRCSVVDRHVLLQDWAERCRGRRE